MGSSTLAAPPYRLYPLTSHCDGVCGIKVGATRMRGADATQTPSRPSQFTYHPLEEPRVSRGTSPAGRHLEHR